MGLLAKLKQLKSYAWPDGGEDWDKHPAAKEPPVPTNSQSKLVSDWLQLMYPDKVVPYGVYTVCAHELGIDETYVSIIARRKGWSIKRKPSSKFHAAKAAA